MFLCKLRHGSTQMVMKHISAMTPHGYDCFPFPLGTMIGSKPERGGGIDFIVKTALSQNIKFTRLDYSTFESAELKLTINQVSAVCVCLYRLHPNKLNKLTFSTFFD